MKQVYSQLPAHLIDDKYGLLNDALNVFLGYVFLGLLSTNLLEDQCLGLAQSNQIAYCIYGYLDQSLV